MVETAQDIFPTEFRKNYIKNFVTALFYLDMWVTLKSSIRNSTLTFVAKNVEVRILAMNILN